MSSTYHMASSSRHTAEIVDVLELGRTGITRLVLRSCRIVNNSKNPEAGVEVTLIHQRKSPKGQWIDDDAESLAKLQAGEAKKLILNTTKTLRLYEHLRNLFEISRTGGVRPGETSLVVGREDEVIRTDETRARLIKSLLARNYTEEVWQEIIEENPDLATKLSIARLQSERTKALDKFKKSLSFDYREKWWQRFFEQNRWIFGYGLKYVFLNTIGLESTIGVSDITGKGVQKVDFLLRSEATLKFTVLVEIKKPGTPLLRATPYRPSVSHLSDELVGGISQIQAECRSWEQTASQSEKNRERLLAERTYAIQPKGILVIGNLSELTTPEMRNTFELFRRNLANPEVITFDELYERARFIVDSSDT